MPLKKLQFNFIFPFLLSVLVFFYTSTGFCQSDTSSNDQAPPQTMESHDTKELDTLIKNYNVDSEKVLEDAKKLNQPDETMNVGDEILNETRSESLLDDARKAALKKVQDEQKKKMLEAQKAIEKGDFSLSVKMALEPLQKLTEEQLRQRITENIKDHPIRHTVDKFPDILTIAIKLIKDTESIPSLVKIAANKNRLIHFVAFMLGTVIFGFFLKKLFHKEGRSFLGVIFFFILRVLILLGVRLYLIYYFFHVELTPAAKVIMSIYQF